MIKAPTRIALHVGTAWSCGLLILAPVIDAVAATQANVTTYHYDNMRTGWNPSEQQLSPSSVGSSSFGLLRTVPVDDQVDAQPLVMADPSGNGHDVVYVATESNTVYRIDAATGKVLTQRNLGTAVPASLYPVSCNNPGPRVGILSTPVIDTTGRTLYAMTQTVETVGGTQTLVYRIHALNTGDLRDMAPSVVVGATGRLTDGTSYKFDAAVMRQRPAMLLSNGVVYAAFGSVCDKDTSLERGWVLGWQAGTLTPLAGSVLMNQDATAPKNQFSTPIWMSGYGLAADQATGSVFFVTGNSDRSGTTYNSSTNLSESVVRLAPDLTSVQDFFTPWSQPGSGSGVATLDMKDRDLGAGGALLLPDQPGSTPHLAAAGGKDGHLYLLNRDNLGGYNPGSANRVVTTVTAGACWCGPSYYRFSDGVGRIVSSGGNAATIWKVETSPSVQLLAENTTNPLPPPVMPQNQGFFTTISSDKRRADTFVIWALARPSSTIPPNITLFAYDAKTANTVFSGAAGSWTLGNGNANLVPVVANGRVFVGSSKQLSIFGLPGN